MPQSATLEHSTFVGLDVSTATPSNGSWRSLKWTERRYAPEETICLEGEPVETLFQVSKGVVKLYKTMPDGRRHIVRFLYAPQWFCSVLSDAHRYTAEAVGPVTTRSLPKRTVSSRLKTDIRVAGLMLEIAAQSLERAENQMILLGCCDAGAKVASFLLEALEASRREAGGAGNAVKIQMRRADIAEYLGLTTETVCRKLTALKKSGVVRMETPLDIAVVDESALRQLAGRGEASAH